MEDLSTTRATWTFDDVWLARSRYWMRRNWPWLFLAFPALGVIFVGIGIWLVSQAPTYVTSWGVIVVGVILALRMQIAEVRVRRDTRRLPSFGHEVTWEFFEDGFHLKDATADVKASWSSVLKPTVTPEGFLIYPQKRLYYWIPISGFPDKSAFERARELLRRHTDCREIGG